jgi:hypothetical protein
MDSDELKQKIGLNDDGTYRVNPETGVVEKEGWFGWTETDTRIDQASGDIEDRGWFGWHRTDTRIDPDSGVVQEETWFGHTDTDKRINPETGSIQDSGWFGWRDTGERIDPETGKHQREGWFGWNDSGVRPSDRKCEDSTRQDKGASAYNLDRPSVSGVRYPSKSSPSSSGDTFTKLAFAALLATFSYCAFVAVPNNLGTKNDQPTSLGPDFAMPAAFIANVGQADKVINYTSSQISEHMFKVNVLVPYEPGYDMDLGFYVDCSNGRIARIEGLQVATSRVEVMYYNYVMRRTCNR